MHKLPSTSSDPAADAEDPPLELPDGRDYRPDPLPISFEAAWRFSEERLALINGQPGALEERWARKALAPFRFHPEDMK